MRKTLCTFFISSLVLVAFLFVAYTKRERVSFKDVVAVKYDEYAHNQNVDKAIRVMKDGKWGVAKKKNGELLLDMKYDFVDNFYEGYAIIKENDLYGAIDEDFNIVVNPIWTYMSPFHLGYSIVTAKNGKSGVIDVNGKIIIKPLYYDYISPFDDNFVARARNFKDNKEVAIDLKGNVVKDFSVK